MHATVERCSLLHFLMEEYGKYEQIDHLNSVLFRLPTTLSRLLENPSETELSLLRCASSDVKECASLRESARNSVQSVMLLCSLIEQLSLDLVLEYLADFGSGQVWPDIHLLRGFDAADS